MLRQQRTFCIMDQQVNKNSKLKICRRKLFLLDQKLNDLVLFRLILQIEPVTVTLVWDEVRLGVKSYSYLVIAGSPRNICKYSEIEIING